MVSEIIRAMHNAACQAGEAAYFAGIPCNSWGPDPRDVRKYHVLRDRATFASRAAYFANAIRNPTDWPAPDYSMSSRPVRIVPSFAI